VQQECWNGVLVAYGFQFGARAGVRILGFELEQDPVPTLRALQEEIKF